jgi:membrane associated rhomboid family serine protease
MFFPLYDENPTETFPLITLSIIAINIAVFLYELSLGPQLTQFINTYAMVPATITQGQQYITIFTAMFLHGGFIHIFGNMLYLWIFGNNIEDTLGHLKFLFFYFLAGIGGAIGHLIVSPLSTVPTLGASGAIAGVLGAYIILFPHARVVTAVLILYFIRIIRLPAILVIGFWIVIQFLSGIASITAQPTFNQAASSVAWFAHIGGFLAGIILIFVLPARRKQDSWS